TSLRWDQVDFLANTISLRAGETKNDDARTIPLAPQLRSLLIEQRGRRQANCPFVCFRVDRKGHAREIGSFRKAWYTACIKAGLGKMTAATDEPETSGRRRKPKTVYSGLLYHDLRRSGVRNLVRAGVPERVAMAISGHKTRAIFDRYNIVSGSDLNDAAK